MPKDIQIGPFKVGKDHPPFIIAELSGNHKSSKKLAIELTEACIDAGAQAIKLQTYTADTMTINCDHDEFRITDEKSLWSGETLYGLYEKAHTPWEWHKDIIDLCKSRGVTCFSSPFDETAVDFLDELGVEAFKVASFENTDVPLIRHIASKGKPTIMSTGMATLEEIETSVRAYREAGGQDLILLQCTSSYPASPKSSNLAAIPDLEKRFDCQVGLSDHTLGIGIPLASVALGGRVIEKHITMSRDNGAVDSAFSLEPHELKAMVEESHRVWESIGDVTYGPTEDDEKSLRYRRSIYVVQDMKAGEVFNEDNTRRIRPGLGLAPVNFEKVLGKKAKQDIKRGSALNWDLVE